MIYVYRDGKLVPKETAPPRATVHLAPQFSDYQSPATAKWITDRRQRREDLKRSDCVEYERPKNAPTGLTNIKFAEKNNAVHLLTPEARDTYETMKSRK